MSGEEVALVLCEGANTPIWVYDRRIDAEFAPTEWWVTRDDGWFPKSPSDKVLATAVVLDERFWGTVSLWPLTPVDEVPVAPSWEQLDALRKVVT